MTAHILELAGSGRCHLGGLHLSIDRDLLHRHVGVVVVLVLVAPLALRRCHREDRAEHGGTDAAKVSEALTAVVDAIAKR